MLPRVVETGVRTSRGATRPLDDRSADHPTGPKTERLSKSQTFPVSSLLGYVWLSCQRREVYSPGQTHEWRVIDSRVSHHR